MKSLQPDIFRVTPLDINADIDVSCSFLKDEHQFIPTVFTISANSPYDEKTQADILRSIPAQHENERRYYELLLYYMFLSLVGWMKK